MRRWLRFNAAGGLGIAVQTAALAFLVQVVRLDYLPATAIAVELAVLHNFAWHRKWTWADRPGLEASGAALMLLRFNLSTGVVSIAGNLVCMRLLVGAAGLHPVAANLVSIACCSLLNFFLSDRFVFIAAWPRPRNGSG